MGAAGLEPWAARVRVASRVLAVTCLRSRVMIIACSPEPGFNRPEPKKENVDALPAMDLRCGDDLGRAGVHGRARRVLLGRVLGRRRGWRARALPLGRPDPVASAS